MTLRFRIGYQYLDYNGEQAESGFTVVDVSNVQALDTFILAAESAMQGVSDARIVSALAYAKMPPYVVKAVTGPATVHRRLLCLFTNGLQFGSFVVPAPRADLDFLTTGPYAGVKIAPAPNPTAAQLAQLATLLGATLLPDGSPFPVGQFQAAVMGTPQ